jgi:methionyl-tRNA formyltransferase
MDEEFDHGAIVTGWTIPIAPEDTYGLHLVRVASVAVRAVELLFSALAHYGAGLPSCPQDETGARCYPRPGAHDLVIRWDEQSGDEIRALVKASNPWNRGAFASVRQINVRLLDVTLKKGGGSHTESPGVVLAADAEEGIVINCVDGSALRLDVIYMEEGFLPGRTLAAYGIRAGERFAGPAGAVNEAE